ncbi:hypothetical protein E2562_023084 [Oryza meyeriana var. granulata]|uniref:Ubiquitin-fold modifier 1 n=1 Tax=Oryza meyeriana var. granulata TaxID=110450 RepID=A0A6G1EP26_9ORYZ|nr:hypothetical protein E2562_023084 [Oryza meyeriana var. granulata]
MKAPLQARRLIPECLGRQIWSPRPRKTPDPTSHVPVVVSVQCAEAAPFTAVHKFTAEVFKVPPHTSAIITSDKVNGSKQARNTPRSTALGRVVPPSLARSSCTAAVHGQEATIPSQERRATDVHGREGRATAVHSQEGAIPYRECRAATVPSREDRGAAVHYWEGYAVAIFGQEHHAVAWISPRRAAPPMTTETLLGCQPPLPSATEGASPPCRCHRPGQPRRCPLRWDPSEPISQS